MKFLSIVLCLALFVAGCSGVEKRKELAQKEVQKSRYQSTIIETGVFPLYTATPKNQKDQQDLITVVIEGDGYAWVSRHTISGDPTPKNPVGLQIATHMKERPMYIARPCQYVRNEKCDLNFWSTDRFSVDVLDTFDNALTVIKAKYGHTDTKFKVIGFSGGGYIALNMAAMRDDVIEVKTIAGLLSPEDWTNFHNITPLRVPYTTRHLFSSTKNISFTHICSREDKVVPCKLTSGIIEQYDVWGDNHTLIDLQDSSHGQIWKSAIQHL